MAETKKKEMRFTDAELSLVKSTFFNNEGLLKALRKHFMQIDITVQERSILSSTFTGQKAIFDVVSKTFLPQIDGDSPLFQNTDLWMTLKLDDKSPQESKAHLIARNLVIEFLTQQLDLLSGKEVRGDTLELSDWTPKLTDVDRDYAYLTARNTILYHIDMMITQLTVLAGQNNETVEETKARLLKDSSK